MRVQTNLLWQTVDGVVSGLYFVDQTTGFAFRWDQALERYSVLLKTTDGGLDWTVVGRVN